MLVGSKGLTIISIIMGLVAIFSLGLGVTATSKYRTQRHRVLELEERLLLGKEAMLKVPQAQLKAQEETAARLEVENQLASANEELEALREEFASYRHDAELVAVAQVAGGRLLAESEASLKIAREEFAAADERIAALEEEKTRLEKQVAALDLDVRAAETKIRNLTKQLGGETSSLYQGGQEDTQEGKKVAHLGFGLAVTGHEIGSPSELHELKQKLCDLTSELITLTKAKVRAEKEVAALQQRLAAR